MNTFGLGALSIIPPGQIDQPLVATNAESWRSEINSFHYNIQIGEMTPTLFDVYDILGLSVVGEHVTCRPINALHKFIEDNLGIVPTEGNLTAIKHSWLKANFWELPPDASPVQIVKYTQAYLLFLISVTNFADASVATVPTRYLQFFEDIEQAHRYAWDAAALAYLYRLLGKACTFKRRHFSGSATLMQVIWNSYFKLDEEISDDRHEAFETVMCVTTLILHDIVEPYMPDHVCRQFGSKQGIPRNPLSVGKRYKRYGRQRDWRNVNSDKIHH
ncbi:hypothetical protein AMTR_s00026p00168780 [Amborella trichopoda]|uniref:Aminotransferase-like plant mobile domain-containing protein n=1 Tax=Amborella trichopoda TaxID=13333 RepID=W1PK90_AMBTC|nr:hypothetical protein AMTR_s00026p00168780 [Amborella trichopoda]